MRERIVKLELGQDALRREVDLRLDAVDKSLEDVKAAISKLPNEWSMAKVLFFVLGALMAAAFFGPRLVSMIPS